jgi:deoxyribodipyrimidine photo-lyase
MGDRLTGQVTEMTRSIVWFRRDLRLADNAALAEAIRQGEVIPVFVIDPVLLQSDRAGPKRVAWLAANLRALDRSLRARGSQLIVRRGEPAAELIRLAREAQATNVFFNLDLTPYARRRDRRVALELEQNGFTVEAFDDMTLHHPEQVVTLTGRPYQVFTAFKKASGWRCPNRRPMKPKHCLNRCRCRCRFLRWRLNLMVILNCLKPVKLQRSIG